MWRRTGTLRSRLSSSWAESPLTKSEEARLGIYLASGAKVNEQNSIYTGLTPPWEREPVPEFFA